MVSTSGTGGTVLPKGEPQQMPSWSVLFDPHVWMKALINEELEDILLVSE